MAAFRTRHSKQFLALTLGAIILASAHSGMTQVATPEGSNSAEGPLQEIIVTAQKRAESIQSVPATILALSQEDIAQRGVVSLDDLALAVPGVNLSSYEPDLAIISIRGVTSVTESPTVGFYLDDVTVSGRSTGFNGQAEPAMLDIQRIEVLKGPQGTVYGASAMGGAIKLVSNPPVKDEFDATLSAGTANVHGGGESYNGQAVVNIPLIGNVLAMRIGASYDFEAGYIDRVPMATGLFTLFPYEVFKSFNTTSESNVNSHQTVATRLAFGFYPDDTLSMVLDFRFQDRKSPDQGSFWVNLPLFEQSNVLAQPIEDRLMLPILTVIKHLGAFDFTSVSADIDRRRNMTLDYTPYIGFLNPAFAASPSPAVASDPIDTLSQEFRISSVDPKARAQFVAGVYWQRENVEWSQIDYTANSGVTWPGVPADETFLAGTYSTLKQGAAFGDLTYSLNHFIDLTVGARAFHIQSNLYSHANGFFNGGASSFYNETSESGVNPKYEVTAKFDKDHLVYALADKGFRPGDVNAPVPATVCASSLAPLGLTAAPNGYQSDSLWNYELGTKNTFAEQRLRVNAALFYLDWKNIQQFISLEPCGFGFTGNEGGAVVKGADFDAAWAPIEQLTLSVAGTYADAYITEGARGTTAVPGDPIQDSPKWVLNGSMEYNFHAMSGWPSYARLDYQWHGSQIQTFQSTLTTDADPYTGASFGGPRTIANPAYLQPSYSQLNASVGLRSPRWSVRLYVDNVTNQHPFLTLYNVTTGNSSGTAAWTLTPRTIGFVVSTEIR